jgi:hypothetical protein
MATPAIQTLLTDAQQVLNLNSLSEVRSTMAAALANANVGTPLNPNLTTQQLWDEFYLIVRQPESDIESIITNQLMKFLFAPPAPGGAGANHEVIYNNNGVLAGDSKFLWDDALNKLDIDGSATISGDLTVDTSTLKVDSSNDRVGIGIAAPAYRLHVQGTASLQLVLQSNDTNANAKEGTVSSRHYTNAEEPVSVVGSYATSTNNYLYVGGGFSGGNAATSIGFYTAANSTTVTGTERYNIASDGVATWSNVGGVAGTAMTLNSTGLGVGVSPSFNIHARGTTDGRIQVEGASGYGMVFVQASSGNTAQLQLNSNGGSGRRYVVASNTSGQFLIGDETAVQTRLLIDSAGNVGIGVTPSAKLDVYQATLGTAYFRGGYSARQLTLTATSDGVNDGAVHTFLIGSSAGQYKFSNSSGTLMSLDASGNLLVGTTDTGSNSGIGIKSVYSSTAPYVATVGSSTSASSYSYLLYSTGGTPAYKFYVSYSGQISATSGTVAALSDARFKENVQDIDVGLGAILALKPRKFDWKAGKGKDIKGDRGFIAQEFEQVFPNLIEEWADPAPEGEAPYKSVRQDLIPVLVKAIQELTARVEALEA